MIFDRRRVAVALAGACVFLDLYTPQALLPTFAQEFGARETETSLLISATSFAIALMAPFTGALADVLGRKRVIAAAMFLLVVPMTLIAMADGLSAMVFWRFLQGFLLPPVFAVSVAYISEEFSGAEAVAVTGVFTSASSIGGFLGRFLTGVLAEHFGWRDAFLIIAAGTLVIAVAIVILLPRERGFVRAENVGSSFRQMLRHLRNPRLVATYGIGFSVLFSFIAIFNYINFRLAQPPFGLSASALGSIFVVYLVGAAAAPLAGRAVARFGRRRLVFCVLAIWGVGLLITLSPSLPVIIGGLAIAAGCGFVCQTLSTSLVAQTAGEGRSAAVGLYVSSYYLGGSAGGVLPGLTWPLAGWAGAVAMVLAILAGVAALVAIFWPKEG